MHGWDGQANEDRDVLWRIVALLFALAGLADQAAGLPFLRRRELLGILGHGEAAARVYFAGMALGVLFEEDAFYDDAPDTCRDASVLAARFRALAFMLAALLTLVDLSAPRRAAARHAGGRSLSGRPAVNWRCPCEGVISPLEGEMPGRAEGGRCPAGLSGYECSTMTDFSHSGGQISCLRERTAARLPISHPTLPFRPAHNMYTLEQSPKNGRAALAKPC